MSIKYVAAVLKHLPELKNPTDVLVLLAIAEHASDETRTAWPSMATLCRCTRLHRVTVQRTVRRLQRLKLLAVTLGGHIDDANTANCYRLEFDHAGKSLDAKEAPKRSFKGVKGAAQSSPPGPRTAAPGAAQSSKGGCAPQPPGLRTAASTVIGTVIEPKSVQSTRAKKIPPAEPIRDLSAEKERQLAALAALKIAATK